MFSVLIRYQKTRREVLLSGKSVEFLPPGMAVAKESISGLLINSGVEGECPHFLELTPEGDPNWGDVFVMNNQGQTVARYVL